MLMTFKFVSPAQITILKSRLPHLFNLIIWMSNGHFKFDVALFLSRRLAHPEEFFFAVSGTLSIQLLRNHS